MPVELPSRRDVAALLGLPFVKSAVSLKDRRADPGLFGPDSVTWRIMREPLLVLGGARALLMQVAHPLVAEGALQHSAFADDPFGRLQRTAGWTARVAFGTTAEADGACRGINRRHRSVEGDLSAANATDRVGGGTHYSARDAELARWVHATLIDTLLVTYETLVRPLPAGDADRFVREWNAVASRVGVPDEDFFTSRAHLSAYIAAQINGGPVLCGAGSRQVAETILTSPIAAAAPAWPALTVLSVALLPPDMRRQYGIPWSPAREAGLRGIARTVRATRVATPSAMRVSATARFAMDRAAGRFEDRGIA